MSEIDLIPQSYRRKLSTGRFLKSFGVLYAGVLITLVTARCLLSFNIDAEASEIQRLEADKNSSLQKKAYVEQLEREATQLGKRVQVLENLRGGPPVKEVFLAIDAALQGQVWFLDWKFLRAGEFVELKPQAVNAGYFIIVPEDDGSSGGERAWQMHTHIEIRAQALSHTALAEFVQRLSTQRYIEDVKVLNTRSHRLSGNVLVDFELAVVVSVQGRTT